MVVNGWGNFNSNTIMIPNFYDLDIQLDVLLSVVDEIPGYNLIISF